MNCIKFQLNFSSADAAAGTQSHTTQTPTLYLLQKLHIKTSSPRDTKKHTQISGFVKSSTAAAERAHPTS